MNKEIIREIFDYYRKNLINQGKGFRFREPTMGLSEIITMVNNLTC